MRLKPGVTLDGVHGLLVIAAGVVDLVQQGHGYGEAVVTSARDGGDAFGPARVRGTMHAWGGALDFRTWAIPPSQLQAFSSSLQAALGPMFQVVVESDHIHVELSAQGYAQARGGIVG